MVLRILNPVCILQVEELRSKQEAEKKKQEVMHSQEVESLKRDHLNCVQGVCRTSAAPLASDRTCLLLTVDVCRFRAAEGPAEPAGGPAEDPEGDRILSVGESCRTSADLKLLLPSSPLLLAAGEHLSAVGRKRGAEGQAASRRGEEAANPERQKPGELHQLCVDGANIFS